MSKYLHHTAISQTEAILLALLQIPDVFGCTSGGVVGSDHARYPEALGSVTMPPSQLLDERALLVIRADLPLAAADDNSALLHGEMVVG